MFIIDFDDTLFDTEQFKLVMNQRLLACGVLVEDIDWSYQAARKLSDGQFAYSHARRAELLATRGYDGQKILKELAEITAPAALEKLVLPGAVQFLETLKSFGQPLILLSLGDPNFQELKVRGSGIEKYFDRLFMVQEKKELVIAELITNHSPVEYWLINDKVGESLVIKKIFPEIHIVLKQSPCIAQIEYEKSGLVYFEQITEIQTYILERYGK